jgi:protein SCO1/2
MESRRLSAGLAVLLVGLLLALAGCSASADEQSEHDMSSMDTGIATVEGGPDTPYRGLAPTEPFPRPTFTLTDSAGAPYDFMAETSGELTLLFFGFTNCPDVCPTTMANVAVALRNVEQSLAQEVNVVFVTTDPARDDAATLGAYLERFDADLPVSFIGLTGDLAAVEAAQSAAGVPIAEDDGQTHSTLLFLAGSVPDDITHDLELIAGK